MIQFVRYGTLWVDQIHDTRGVIDSLTMLHKGINGFGSGKDTDRPERAGCLHPVQVP